MSASGECIWTYNYPDATHSTGYWTVEDQCTSGSCSTGVDSEAAKGLKVPHDQFADKVRAEYKARGKKLSDEQELLLKEPPKAAGALKGLQPVRRFHMPCV